MHTIHEGPAGRRILAAAALSSGIAWTGCASTLSTLVDPETTPRGKVHLDMGEGLYLPVGATVKVIDQGVKEGQRLKELAQTGQHPPLSEDEQRSLLEAGLALAVMPPAAVWEVQARTGIVDNVDVGLRYSVNQVRLDGRYRFFHAEKVKEPEGPPPGTGEPAPVKERILSALRPDDRLRSYDATLQIGAAYYLFSNPVFEVLDFIKMGDFSRWDFDAAITWGLDIRRIFKFYVGPKFVLTRFSMDERLYEVASAAGEVANLVVVDRQDHWIWFAGGTVGIAVGYKWVFLFLELTGGYTYARPVVLAAARDLGGVTLYPAASIAAKFP